MATPFPSSTGPTSSLRILALPVSVCGKPATLGILVVDQFPSPAARGARYRRIGGR